MDTLFATPPSAGLLVGRVALGLTMFAHGSQKLFGWFGGQGYDATMSNFAGEMGLPAAMAVLVMLAETLGGIGLVLGLLTRVAAAGILAVMFGAVFLVHVPNGFFMNWSGTKAGEGFEYHVLAIGLSLVLMTEGAGAYSIDRMLAAELAPPLRRPAAV